MSNPVQIVDYDPRWPGRFLAEAARVSRVLSDCVVAIHHIGSTAVPNLCAKPVIDILVQVSSLSIFDRQSKVLQPLGYESMGEYGLSGRRFFRKGDVQRTHHIHVYAADNPEPMRHVHFRDYLRAHPQIAERYAKIKRQAMLVHSDSREDYQLFKASFIESEERQALAWAASKEDNKEEEIVTDSETLYGVPVMSFLSDESED